MAGSIKDFNRRIANTKRRLAAEKRSSSGRSSSGGGSSSSQRKLAQQRQTSQAIADWKAGRITQGEASARVKNISRGGGSGAAADTRRLAAFQTSERKNAVLKQTQNIRTAQEKQAVDTRNIRLAQLRKDGAKIKPVNKLTIPINATIATQRRGLNESIQGTRSLNLTFQRDIKLGKVSSTLREVADVISGGYLTELKIAKEQATLNNRVIKFNNKYNGKELSEAVYKKANAEQNFIEKEQKSINSKSDRLVGTKRNAFRNLTQSFSIQKDPRLTTKQAADVIDARANNKKIQADIKRNQPRINRDNGRLQTKNKEIVRLSGKKNKNILDEAKIFRLKNQANTLSNNIAVMQHTRPPKILAGTMPIVPASVIPSGVTNMKFSSKVRSGKDGKQIVDVIFKTDGGYLGAAKGVSVGKDGVVATGSFGKVKANFLKGDKSFRKLTTFVSGEKTTSKKKMIDQVLKLQKGKSITRIKADKLRASINKAFKPINKRPLDIKKNIAAINKRLNSIKPKGKLKGIGKGTSRRASKPKKFKPLTDKQARARLLKKFPKAKKPVKRIGKRTSRRASKPRNKVPRSLTEKRALDRRRKLTLKSSKDKTKKLDKIAKALRKKKPKKRVKRVGKGTSRRASKPKVKEFKPLTDKQARARLLKKFPKAKKPVKRIGKRTSRRRPKFKRGRKQITEVESLDRRRKLALKSSKRRVGKIDRLINAAKPKRTTPKIKKPFKRIGKKTSRRSSDPFKPLTQKEIAARTNKMFPKLAKPIPRIENSINVIQSKGIGRVVSVRGKKFAKIGRRKKGISFDDFISTAQSLTKDDLTAVVGNSITARGARTRFIGSIKSFTTSSSGTTGATSVVTTKQDMAAVTKVIGAIGASIAKVERTAVVVAKSKVLSLAAVDVARKVSLPIRVPTRRAGAITKKKVVKVTPTTTQVSKPIQIKATVAKGRRGSRSVQKPIQKPTQKPVQKGKPKQKPKNKQVPRERARERQKQKQAQRDAQKKKQLLKQVTLARVVARTTVVTTPKIIAFTFKVPKGFTKKTLKSTQPVFYVKIKMRGKIVSLNPRPMILRDARDFLAYKVDNGLSRSAWFEPMGRSKTVLGLPKKMRGYFSRNRRKFRAFKVKVGKKKAIRNGYIELAKHFHDTKREKAQAKRIRKRKPAKRKRGRTSSRKIRRK